MDPYIIAGLMLSDQLGGLYESVKVPVRILVTVNYSDDKKNDPGQEQKRFFTGYFILHF